VFENAEQLFTIIEITVKSKPRQWGSTVSWNYVTNVILTNRMRAVLVRFHWSNTAGNGRHINVYQYAA